MPASRDTTSNFWPSRCVRRTWLPRSRTFLAERTRQPIGSPQPAYGDTYCSPTTQSLAIFRQALFLPLHCSEATRTIANPLQTFVAPQRLHWVGPTIVAHHVEGRAGDLQSVADPGALVPVLPALIVEPGAVLDKASLLLSAGIGDGFRDLVPQNDGDSVDISARSRVDEVLSATAEIGRAHV